MSEGEGYTGFGEYDSINQWLDDGGDPPDDDEVDWMPIFQTGEIVHIEQHLDPNDLVKITSCEAAMITGRESSGVFAVDRFPHAGSSRDPVVKGFISIGDIHSLDSCAYEDV